MLRYDRSVLPLEGCSDQPGGMGGRSTILYLYQVKKLVYVYLMRYAEEQQDLALLSISTFQRALKVCQDAINHS